MIIIISGGIGSGKTLTAVKELVDRQQLSFTNFNLYKCKNYRRLRYENLFIKKQEGKKFKTKLNFDFWNNLASKNVGFDVFLDEFHNLMSSRRSISTRNVLLSDWLSQIRKYLGQSEQNNLYLLTQKLRRIDINSRDLAHLFIHCEKVEYPELKIDTKVYEYGRIVTKKLPVTMIYKFYFQSPEALEQYVQFGMKTYFKVTRFIGNWYYRYFNSYEIIDFGSEEYI